MGQYEFERDVRTPHSESYTISSEGEAVARADLHFAPGGAVHATLCVPEGFDEEAIEELIADVDERLVLTADPERADFVVTVWRGSLAGVYSEDDDDDDEEDDVSGNGRVGG